MTVTLKSVPPSRKLASLRRWLDILRDRGAPLVERAKVLREIEKLEEVRP